MGIAVSASGLKRISGSADQASVVVAAGVRRLAEKSREASVDIGGLYQTPLKSRELVRSRSTNPLSSCSTNNVLFPHSQERRRS